MLLLLLGSRQWASKMMVAANQAISRIDRGCALSAFGKR